MKQRYYAADAGHIIQIVIELGKNDLQISVGNNRAYFSINGKRHHIGTYDTIEEAKIARDKFAKSSNEEYFKS